MEDVFWVFYERLEGRKLEVYKVFKVDRNHAFTKYADLCVARCLN